MLLPSRKIVPLVIAIIFVIGLFTPVPTYADVVHRVAPGESLYLIAQTYRVTVDDLLNKNYLRDLNYVFPRQVLIIPGVDKTDFYRIERGDTLFKISQKLNISMADLGSFNRLVNPDQLTPGQVLFLSAKTPEPKKVQRREPNTYTVKPNDTLYLISMQFGVSMDRLVIVNQLSNPELLEVGQVLEIPAPDIKNPNPGVRYSVPQLMRIFPETLYARGVYNSNSIALTFDDGPDKVYTTGVLDVLKKYDVPATFFLVGENSKLYPEVVQRMVEENHVIANHSWSHPDLSKISAEAVLAEMERTEQILEDVTGLRTALMRPPYGFVSYDLIQQLKDLDYKVIHWSVDSIDWRDRDVDQILINTLPDVREGGILLFHSAGSPDLSATVGALPELIETLQMLGYNFVTVDELLGVPAYR